MLKVRLTLSRRMIDAVQKVTTACAMTALLIAGVAVTGERAVAQDIQSVDTDHYGTVDLDEAKAAGLKMFDQLDKDHRRVIDAKQAEDSMDASDFKKADTDTDGRLEKKEFINHLQDLFHEADTDQNFKLSKDELNSPAGKKLMKLIHD